MGITRLFLCSNYQKIKRNSQSKRGKGRKFISRFRTGNPRKPYREPADYFLTSRKRHQKILLLSEPFLGQAKVASYLQSVCMQMYEYDPQIFRSLIRHKDFKGRSKRIIAETAENMRTPQKIAEGIFIEMNLNANEALNYAKLVIDKYDGMENECCYKLKPVQ